LLFFAVVESKSPRFEEAAKGGAPAEDFGVSGTWNKQTGAQFQQALENIVNGPNTQEYSIEFRGESGFSAFLDQPSGRAVIFDQAGNFRAAWDLGADQVKGIVVNGRLW
jgi:Colicin D